MLAPLASGSAAQSVQYLGSFGDYFNDVSDTGYLVGPSFPTNTGTHMIGWVGTPGGQMHRIGLYDALHTSETGRWFTITNGVNNHGVSIGSSSIFEEPTLRGKSAWVANAAGQTIRLGFYDAEHTSADGTTWHDSTDINESNQVVGYSSDFRDHATGWIVGPRTPLTRLGLFDAAHTSTDGKHWSEARRINNAGYVLGFSRYYNGRDAQTYGQTPWLYTPWKAMRILGFQSGVHRTPTGWYTSDIGHLTHSGYITGTSRRYQNTGRRGYTAWLTHVAGPNRPIGYYDGIHRAPDSSATSGSTYINERGTVAGYSLQYSAQSTDEYDRAGITTWLAVPSGQTVRVGLYGPEHTFAGHQDNTLSALSQEDDAVVGYAARFDPVTGSEREGRGGRTAWLADLSGTTMALGPVDADHTRADGYRSSMPVGVNARYVWGQSDLFRSGFRPGGSAWVYDRVQGTTTIINQVGNAPPEFADSYVSIVNVASDGTVIGYYSYQEQESRAFIYVPGQGVQRLMDIDTSPDTVLEDVWRVTSTGYIVGYEHAPGDPLSSRVYLLKR